jgi:hypothetical protein
VEAEPTSRVQDASLDQVDIAEAARRLQTTPDAIRKRIRRGSLDAVKLDGRWYVVLDAARATSAGQSTSHILDTGQDAPESGRTDDQDASRTALVESLQDEVLFLRAELAKRSEEIERRDVIIAQLAERIPRRLEAPTVSEPPVPAPVTEQPAERPAPRPWWRFW